MTDFHFLDDDTIAAISTPPGEGGIGIVRLSGPQAISITEELFHSPKGKTLKSHRIVYGFIKDPETGADVDEVLVAVMKSPLSYTREDVVEINCHGGTLPLMKVLELVLSSGARIADPGEFTKRAFLNGRIDLSQAEAALDLIRASTEMSERIALEQLRGELSRRVGSLREKLIGTCAVVEAHMDFPEDEIEPPRLAEIKDAIEALIGATGSLAASYDEGRLFREGLKTAIVGRPNVGKSSLLNALLQRDRAIVTEVPGTTRDTIEEHLNIRGLPVKVVDTAGIREAHDMVEEEGVRRSMRALEDADLVLAVFDAGEPLHDEDMMVIEKIRNRNAILVLNKIDIPDVRADLPVEGVAVVKISAKTGEGIENLKDAVFDSSVRDKIALTEGIIVTNLRHKIALEGALKSLRSALHALEGKPLEITAMELRDAADRLGEIVGLVTTDDILNRIFSDFCIGK